MDNLLASLNKLMDVDGALCAALIETQNGLVVHYVGNESLVGTAAVENSRIVRIKVRTMKMLNLNDFIEDIIISLHSQYHLIRPVGQAEGGECTASQAGG